MKKNEILVAAIIVLGAAIFFFSFRRPAASSSSAATGRQVPALAKKWEFAASGTISGALALADDGTIYAASMDGFLYALDPSGRLQWKTHIGPSMSSPAVGEDGTIYVTNNSGWIFAINHSGGVSWRTQGSPDGTWSQNAGALSHDYLYIPTRSSLAAVRLTNGQIDWESHWGGDQWGSVTLLPDGTLLSPGRGRLSALDARGEVAWQLPSLSPEATAQNGGYPPPGDFSVVSGIAVDTNRTLYAGVSRCCVAAIGMDGLIKWEVKASGALNFSTPLVSADGTIIFGGGDGNLHAVNPFGITKWTLSMQYPIRPTPVLAQDGSIFVLNSRFLSLVSADGHLLTRVDIGSAGESSPTLAPDGTIITANSEGRVMAFAGGHGGLMNSPWPKYQADVSNSGNPHLK